MRIEWNESTINPSGQQARFTNATKKLTHEAKSPTIKMFGDKLKQNGI
jgi:hypothetical protein